MKSNIKFFFISTLIFLIASCKQDKVEEVGSLVKNISELNQAIKAATPGKTIVMADGEWSNAEINFIGKGEENALITLTAQTAGKVILKDQSTLSISGEYLVVSGLVFKDGYTPTSEVISFKTSKSELANNCRITNCVIDNYSNPERFDSDLWLAVFGKNNRIDHNSFIGKGNLGVTMAVRIPTEASQDNKHIIENNYFGPRQVLGSNGGETLRIGTSHYSRTYSNTIVRNNFFDRVNGEHEIISNKSCGNQFEGNVFYESQGTLTMRHGHHTLVKNNYFLGNRKPNTGGIRIINEYQTVQNNYLSGLTGHRFRGALVIMNGVPNSPINRYNQVIDSKMENNMVINSDYIQLCAGSDEERSAKPIGTTFKNNLILGENNLNPFTIYDDVSGITFEGNVMNESSEIPFEEGFEKVALDLSKNEYGLLTPNQDLMDRAGFSEIKLPVNKEETGANFYSKDGTNRTFGSGKVIKVPAGKNSLVEAIKESASGDILELESGGEYLLTKYAIIHHPLSILTPQGEKASILSEKQSFFKVENGGAITLKNVIIDGAESPDLVGNNVISTSKYSMNLNYAVVVENCEVKDLDVNHSFDFLKSYKHTFADSINIINSNFSNITGSIMGLDMEVEDLGIYNAENVNIIDSKFEKVGGAILNIYRGGTDESTFGPIVRVEHVEISESGNSKRNKVKSAMRFHGVQKLSVNEVSIANSKGIDLHLTNGEPISNLTNITFEKSEGLRYNSKDFKSSNISVK